MTSMNVQTNMPEFPVFHTYTDMCVGLNEACNHCSRSSGRTQGCWCRFESKEDLNPLRGLFLNTHLRLRKEYFCAKRWNFSWIVGEILHSWEQENYPENCTYCLIHGRKASMMLKLWCGVTCLEYESQCVAWRKDRIFALMISGIFLATKLPQDL